MHGLRKVKMFFTFAMVGFTANSTPKFPPEVISFVM